MDKGEMWSLCALLLMAFGVMAPVITGELWFGVTLFIGAFIHYLNEI